MDPEQAARAFDTFYTTKPGGLGMGLSICRSIIEAHEGTMTIAHNDPRGLIVSFVVPTRPAKSTEQEGGRKRRTSVASEPR